MAGTDRPERGVIRHGATALGGVRPAGIGLFLSVQIGAFVLAMPYERATLGIRVGPGPTGIGSVALGVAVGVVLVVAAHRFGVLRDGTSRRRLGLVVGSVFALAVALLAFVLGESIAAAVVVWALTVVVLVVRPSRVVRNAIGVLAGASLAAALGTVLTPLAVIAALAGLSGYDAYSISRSGRMRVVARLLEDLRTPAVLTLPGRQGGTDRTGRASNGWTLGLGDAVLPATLVASARVAVPSSVPALGALVGGCCGLVVLSALASPEESYAGLPALAAGSVGGYLGGALLVGAPLGVSV